ncbi:MAG TPA: VOC family protein [Pinirhizobacter sp.]|uniref:VOC family protein n=1 Tax=Pinirhizobacter sp. TaxID=2950432 RepID=UPI002BCC29A4|nr:VOC family protein [Pinirhizobacter sp.]HMH66881.1 VOC family protein [Pinirhizobacter sp.]
MAEPYQRISPFLWFDDKAEEAAKFYVSIFPNSKIHGTTHYPKGETGPTGRPPGSVMTVAFSLDGQLVTAINGGPMFHFTEALSLVVMCHDQKEIDHFWSKLGEGGDPNAQVCGWLKDKYGLSWQIVPKNVAEIAGSPKAMEVMMQMKKLDMAALNKALAA